MPSRRSVTLAIVSIAILTASAFAQPISVVNGASYVPGQAIAPGSFATIFGDRLAPAPYAAPWNAWGELPVTLGGVSVTVSGRAAGLYYVSPRQINFHVPAGLAPGAASLEVSTGPARYTVEVSVGTAAPGVFTWSGTGLGDGACLDGSSLQRGPFTVATGGRPAELVFYLTGLDLSAKPEVLIAGTPVEVVSFGGIPAWPGVQMVKVELPVIFDAAGRVPVVIRSNGQTSNVTYIEIAAAPRPPNPPAGGLPGDLALTGHEGSSVAINSATGAALVVGEQDDVVRVVSLDTKAVMGTIPLPKGSLAHFITVNPAGTLAAVPLSGKASVAIIDLKTFVVTVVPTGDAPSHAAFSTAGLLVTNLGSGTVSLLELNPAKVAASIPAGFGPDGVAAFGNTAVVANMQDGTVSVLDLGAKRTTDTIPLGRGMRPREVAFAGDGQHVVITTPTQSGFAILDLATRQVTSVETGMTGVSGSGGLLTAGNTAYIANQLSGTVTVADIAAAAVKTSIRVDPGPRSLALNPGKNQLVVLCATGHILDLVDLATNGIVRVGSAGSTPQPPALPGGGGGGMWQAPTVSSVTPRSGAAGSTFTMTITGTNLNSVTGIVFDHVDKGQAGTADTRIVASNLKAGEDGAVLTATVQIASGDTPGWRALHLETAKGAVYWNMLMSLFQVTP